MIRKPIHHEMDCFGVNRVDDDPVCQACRFRVDCAVFMGKRDGKTPLSSAKFAFVPDGLIAKYPKVKSSSGTDRIYTMCHVAVFGTQPVSLPGLLGREIEKRAKEAGCNLELFVYTNMMGRQKTQPDCKFYPSMLTGDFSVKQIETWRELCIHKFSHFTLKTLSASLDERVYDDSLENRMEAAETRAGTFIIRHKLTSTGAAYPALYDKYEQWLDPVWLATEETYYNYRLKGISHKSTGGGPVEAHRFAAAKERANLKRHKRQAIAAFEQREASMPAAIRTVLGRFGLFADDFDYPDKEITDPIQFWTKLGLAVQQWECIKYLEELPNVYNERATRNLQLQP